MKKWNYPFLYFPSSLLTTSKKWHHVSGLCCCWGYDDVHGPCCVMSVVCAATGSHVGAHGLCSHRRPCWYPWFILPPKAMWMIVAVLPPKAMLMATAYAATKGHDGPCCGQGLCWCLRYTHLQEGVTESHNNSTEIVVTPLSWHTPPTDQLWTTNFSGQFKIF